jgi:hypothetical protein
MFAGALFKDGAIPILDAYVFPILLHSLLLLVDIRTYIHIDGYWCMPISPLAMSLN